MTWMLESYPCYKRQDRATQRSALMDYHCSHSHCTHYTYDNYCYWHRQEFQLSMELVEVDLELTVCAGLRRHAGTARLPDPVLIDTYPALE